MAPSSFVNMMLDLDLELELWPESSCSVQSSSDNSMVIGDFSSG